MKLKVLPRSAGVGACVGLALAAALCAISLPAQVQLPDVSNDYTIQTVQPPDDAVNLFYFSVNDSGMAVLSYWAVDSVDCGDGAVLDHGQWKRLHTPMPDGTISAHTSPCNIDSSGRIAVCYNVYSGELYSRA